MVAAGFFVSLDAYATPTYDRDGWIDQGGKYHAFPRHNDNNGTGGQPGTSDNNHQDNSAEDNGASGAADSGSSEGPEGANNSYNSDAPVGGAQDGGQGGGSSDVDLAGLNTTFNDPPLDNGPGEHGSPGGTQNDDGGGWSSDAGGPGVAVPEPSGIALLTGALLVSRAARRRRRAK